MPRKHANLKYPSVTFNHYQLNLAAIISIVVSVKILPIVYLVFGVNFAQVIGLFDIFTPDETADDFEV